MKLFSLLALAACTLFAVKSCTASLYNASAHHDGPQHIVDDRYGWKISYGPHGSVVLRTEDRGRSWKDRTPPDFARAAPNLDGGNAFASNFGLYANDDAYASSFGLSALESQRCWIAFGSRISNKIVVKQTRDGGQHWRSGVIDGRADTVVLQFVDSRHGFLLALGGSAAGLMAKRVYETSDGSRTWHLVSKKITSNASFYPNGMVFHDPLDGWITADYHGKLDALLYHTADGGRTWHPQLLPKPDVYQNGDYGNIYPPQFFGRQKRDGSLIVNYGSRTIYQFETITYLTHDGGQTWCIGRRIRTKTAVGGKPR